ncbi:MAG TPA: LacI family DNA-binding transcriptional regulator [Clostridia bacterium]|nr:LacI family DNA-binding transcriptional regulator [Clostridia bacterium]
MGRITIKDIANELNITPGTVSKALNGKAGVKPEIRKRVVETAARLGYDVNRLAQSLARRPVNIGIVIPSVWPEFYGYLKMGIEQELYRLRDHKINGIYTTVTSLNSTDEVKKALNGFMGGGVDAVIICPAFDSGYEEELNALESMGIPVVILGGVLEKERALACIHADSACAGRLAADFARWLGIEGKTAVLIGKNSVLDHSRKAQAFIDRANKIGINTTGVYETFDDPGKAYEITSQILDQSLSVIYVATGNSVAVCKCLRDKKVNNRVKVIATDIFPQMRPFVEDDTIQGIIFQNPVWQGVKAVEIIYDYLIKGIEPQKEILALPHFVLPGNFDGYLYNLQPEAG